jgi:hypothetical protein
VAVSPVRSLYPKFEAERVADATLSSFGQAAEIDLGLRNDIQPCPVVLVVSGPLEPG